MHCDKGGGGCGAIVITTHLTPGATIAKCGRSGRFIVCNLRFALLLGLVKWLHPQKGEPKLCCNRFVLLSLSWFNQHMYATYVNMLKQLSLIKKGCPNVIVFCWYRDINPCKVNLINDRTIESGFRSLIKNLWMAY